jgi:hypothetical protein
VLLDVCAQTVSASRRVRDGRDFHASLEKLRQLGHSERCVIMCAETLMVAMSPADHFGIIRSTPARLSFTFSGQITSREPS